MRAWSTGCVAAACAVAFACSGDDSSGSGASGGADAGADGSAGTAGSGATGGSGGASGASGSAGVAQGGSGGSGGSTGGASGAGGVGGTAGSGGAAGAAGSDGGDVGTPPNVAFVTSQSWVAHSLGGLAGADAKCAAAASAVGLPGTFVAWLSDSSSDASDRLGSARGWVRTDGRPFVDTVDDLLALRHLYPLHVDENGTRIVVANGVATGTGPDGLRQSATGDFCQDWTGENAAVGFVGGDPDSFGPNWTGGGGANPLFTIPCTTEAALYCFQIDHSDPLPPITTPSRRVFVTRSGVGTVGLAGLDQHCADQASAGGVFTGDFLAFVATNGASALSRFDTSGPPWGRRDGVLIADTAADVATATQLLAPIHEFSDGTFVWDSPGGDLVYAGAATPASAGSTPETCDDWTDLLGTYVFGSAGLSTQEWWSDLRLPSPRGCNTNPKVYCFEE